MSVARFTDKTLVPIGLAVLVIGGGASWVTGVSKELTAQASAIEHARDQYLKIDDRLRSIENQLIQLNGTIERITISYSRSKKNQEK